MSTRSSASKDERLCDASSSNPPPPSAAAAAAVVDAVAMVGSAKSLCSDQKASLCLFMI